MVYKVDMQDPQKNDYWIFQKKARHFFRVPASWKDMANILQDTGESDWQTANIGELVIQISCFMEKSARCYGPVGWR